MALACVRAQVDTMCYVTPVCGMFVFGDTIERLLCLTTGCYEYMHEWPWKCLSMLWASFASCPRSVYLMSLYSWLWSVAFGGTIGLILLNVWPLVIWVHAWWGWMIPWEYSSMLLSLFGLCTMDALHTHVCLHWVLPSAAGGVFALSLLGAAEGEACGCTKLHTMCLLMQHSIEMSRHFGTELSNICIYGH